MAFTLVTPQLTIARNAGALYGVTVGTADMASYTTLATLPGVTTASFLNSVYMSSIGSTPTTAVAAELVANLGITGANATTAQAFVVAQLNAGTPATRGAIIDSVLSAFSGLTADATFGAAATAWNAQVANAVAYASVPGNVTSAGTTFTMSTHQDNILASAKDDMITAPIIDNSNTLQSGDVVNGGLGNDTLQADMGTSAAFAVTPNLINVEKVSIRAQAVQADPTNGNNTGGVGAGGVTGGNTGVFIDAQRSAGVTTWESMDSRSDVIVEDVRTDSNKSTISFVQSDPGNVDLGVYFNERNLVNTTGGSSSVNILVMDTNAASVAATAATPLLNVFFNSFTFYADNAKIVLGGAGTPAGAAIDAATTYPALLAAFELALKDAGLAGVVTASLSAIQDMTTAAGASTAAPSFLHLPGQVLILTANTSVKVTDSNTVTKEAGGWAASGIAPTTGAIAQTMNSGATSSAALVSTSIILDDVGLGDTGGDLVVGGMSTGITSNDNGVQLFTIEVRDNSKLQTINSTNNTLREVYINNGVTNQTSTAYVTTVKDAGDLTVNGVTAAITNVDNQLAGTAAVVGTNQTFNHSAAGSAGFTDVRVIDASAMVGKFAFTAAVTSDSINKYVNLVDTQVNPAADVATANTTGLGANFIYTGGSNNDTMVVKLDTVVVGSRSHLVSGREDFTFNINGGAGDDKITVYVNDTVNTGTGGTQNWYNNQDLNGNITVIGGNGADTIRTPGAGDKIIYGGNTDGTGTGNDTIYSDNSGSQAGVIFNAVTVGTNSSATKGITAEWAFNTTDQLTAVAPARNINDLRSDNNTLGDNNIGYNLFKAGLTVTFQGATSQVPVTLTNTTTYTTTDLEINQAIKTAINSDPVLSKLLIAQDGPGNSLVVVSLIDGVMSTTDLTVNLTAPALAILSPAEITAAGAVYLAKGTVATDALVNAAMTTALTTFTAKGDYVTAMANDGAFNITGDNSATTSDNLIYPANGNDVIVLGTTDVTVAGNTLAQDQALSSNETVIYNTGFGNDTIVNFMATGNGFDHLDLTFGSLGGSVLSTGFTTNQSINVAALNTSLVAGTGNSTAALVAGLFTADNVTATGAQTHVYVAVNASNIGSVYTVADPVGANNAVATLQGTIDLLATNGNANDNVWSTLTAANFVNVAGTVGGVKAYSLQEGPSAVTAVAPPAGFTAVPLAVGLTAAGAVTNVVAAAAAESFSLNVGAARLSAPNTQDSITGFDVATDMLSFSGTGIAPGTTYTLASVLTGITSNVDGINNQTIVTFGPDANADVISLTLVGVATATDLVHVTIVS